MKLALRCLVLGLILSSLPAKAQYFGMPEPPENDWSIGLGIGPCFLLGDVRADGPGLWTSVYLNRELGRIIDIRFSVGFGSQRGQDLMPSYGFLNNTALNGVTDSLANYPAGSPVFYNYRMSGYDANFSVRGNINRIFSETGLKTVDLYLLAGIGVFGHRTRINAYDEARGQIYDYLPLADLGAPVVQDRLSTLLDGTYETPGQSDPANSRFLFNNILHTSFLLGLGGRYHFDGGLAAGLELRYQYISDDLVDGQMWNENNELTDNRDKLLTLQLTIDYSF